MQCLQSQCQCKPSESWNVPLAGGSGKQVIEAAAAAARVGADDTKNMKASKGRSSYVPEDVLASVPDPGAQGCAIWLQAVATSFL